MKNAILLLMFSLISYLSVAQKLEQRINRDTATYVFELNKNQLINIFENNTIKDTTWFFEKMFKEQTTVKFEQNKLPFGSYIIANVYEGIISYHLFVQAPFDIKTKLIKDDFIFFLQNKKDKQVLKTAKMQLGNVEIPYDSGYGGYAIKYEKLNENIKQLISIYTNEKTFVIKPLSVAKQETVKTPSYKSNVSAGFCVTDKPVYKLNDTLKIKSFLVKYKNGKPLHRKITIFINEPSQNFNFHQTIKPTTAGAYIFEWKIPDTLKMDRNYNITLSYQMQGRNIAKTSQFYVEDYTLAKNKMDVQFKQQIFYEGEDMGFWASATDANNFPLNNVVVNYNVYLVNVHSILKDSLLMSENWRQNIYNKDTVLPYSRLSFLNVPSNILPLIDADYSINVTLTDPVTFEQKTFSQTVSKIRHSENALFYQAVDSLHLRVLFNNHDTNRIFTLI